MLSHSSELEPGIERLATLDGLLFPRDNDYYATQALARYLSGLGFTGILYPSAFCIIGGNESKNLVIFGCPLKERAVDLLDINRLGVSAINYDLRFGPAF
jgi:hypothetical protein